MCSSPMMYVATFQQENEYITKTRLIAKGALRTWPKSDDDGANDTGCGVPTRDPAIRKATISTTFTIVANSVKVEECLMPVSWTSDTSQTTPSARASGGPPATTALAY